MVVEIGAFVFVSDIVDSSLVVTMSFSLIESPVEVEKQLVIGVPWLISLADVDGDVGVLPVITILVFCTGDAI